MLIHRTLLVGNQLNGSNFRFRTQTALTKSGAIYLLEVALVLNGIGVADDGTNFVQVVPLSRLAYLKLQAPERDPAEPLLDPGSIKRIGFLTPFKPARPGQMGPRGTIDELVAYYAELTDRTAVSFPQFGSVSITFSAQTPLTKRELLYAIETTLALNGVSIVEVDDKTIKAAHIPQRDRAEKKSDEL
jgi:hypothetical protein